MAAVPHEELQKMAARHAIGRSWLNSVTEKVAGTEFSDRGLDLGGSFLIFIEISPLTDNIVCKTTRMITEVQ